MKMLGHKVPRCFCGSRQCMNAQDSKGRKQERRVAKKRDKREAEKDRDND